MKMATLTKCRNAAVPLIALGFFFIIAHLAFAETKDFVEEYSYQASEADSKISSRVIALEQVKRLLLEKLGIYLESETEVKNFHLTKDQIVILTAGIVRTEILEERWNGKTYYLKAKISADPQDVANSIDKLRQDRQKTKELEETRKKADEALREVERLKKEVGISNGRKANLSEYNEAVKKLSDSQWLEKQSAFMARITEKYRLTIEASTKAIELDPNNFRAYVERAAAYLRQDKYQEAIKDID